jgi:hypothetical protein
MWWWVRCRYSSIQCYGSWFIKSVFGSSISSESDPVAIRFRIQGFDDQKLEKNTAVKTFFFFWSKIAIYLSLGLLNGHPSYRRSLQPSKEYIQHLKTWNFLTYPKFFYFLWVRIRIHKTASMPLQYYSSESTVHFKWNRIKLLFKTTNLCDINAVWGPLASLVPNLSNLTQSLLVIFGQLWSANRLQDLLRWSVLLVLFSIYI